METRDPKLDTPFGEFIQRLQARPSLSAAAELQALVPPRPSHPPTYSRHVLYGVAPNHLGHFFSPLYCTRGQAGRLREAMAGAGIRATLESDDSVAEDVHALLHSAAVFFGADVATAPPDLLTVCDEASHDVEAELALAIIVGRNPCGERAVFWQETFCPTWARRRVASAFADWFGPATVEMVIITRHMCSTGACDAIDDILVALDFPDDAPRQSFKELNKVAVQIDRLSTVWRAAHRAPSHAAISRLCERLLASDGVDDDPSAAGLEEA